MAASEAFETIILDRMLPGGIDGIRLLETLRSQNNTTPVLVLSALSQVDERVAGLKAGGDDYLTKPFAFSELLARVEALTRRGRGEAPTTKLVVGDLEMDLLSRMVRRGGQKIDLQPREFRLLEYLMRHGGQVVTRTMLPGRRVGLPLRPTDERHRRACVQASPEDRQAVPHAADPHHPERRLYAPPGVA